MAHHSSSALGGLRMVGHLNEECPAAGPDRVERSLSKGQQ